MGLRRSFALALVLSTAGCIQVKHVPDEDDPAVSDTVYELLVTDTIGVLAGDSSLVFGDIADASFTASGDIVILDRMNGKVSQFSAEGEYLTSAGGFGEAPWEFSLAAGMAPMFDGSLMVFDYIGRKIVHFDGSLGFISSATGYELSSRGMLSPLPDGTFIGKGTELRQGGEQELQGENQIRRFSMDSTGYLTQYLASPMFITILDDGIDLKPADIACTSSIDGTVYCSVRSDSLYEITGWTTGGVETVSISEPWERVPKTPEEINDQGRVPAIQTDAEGNRTRILLDVEVNPFHNAVADLTTDDQGRLWVRLGSFSVPTFRVYDGQGEFLFTVTCPELERTGRQIRFQTRHGGIVAWDTSPEDYPKVYVLDMVTAAAE